MISKGREVFFQAVSNSSWANEGYLVAVDIDTSNDNLIHFGELQAPLINKTLP
ncbi:hypothetical protein [Anaerobacillus arseniciselenatis]|uniref:hypothetical protein n=1 Tax=Anaerobacillus arseniciselenatis TaxID=85682 RepID=UPI000AF4D949|nr:hypothetical protein [Anaerobacillus arseniciselenatis]